MTGGGVSTRDFGAREDAKITDLEAAGSGTDTHTLMGLTKGQVSLLSDILEQLTYDTAAVTALSSIRRTPRGYQQITSVSASIGLAVPANAIYALIQCESQAVRWRDDGTAPSATVGMPLAVGDILVYDGDLTLIKFIEQTASAKVNIYYFS